MNGSPSAAASSGEALFRAQRRPQRRGLALERRTAPLAAQVHVRERDARRLCELSACRARYASSSASDGMSAAATRSVASRIIWTR